ncbi:protoporphyrin IX magnesium-chelatase [Thermanaeromonas toyohensis ToBE]|uniref:Mg-protoporphyrin IX chelatase n=1 Tax=Thermanaeromonas toyohensis ToBE TaxID=698762 RepID=A0A1W1VCV8_9FIRM|nr:putative cobaltochelatase [Thermanaeromonas toyohensis]SMB91208.1 protoporphyrin IX magnesium-chelatase [Thermanaeromonas toyohensis ToBE]
MPAYRRYVYPFTALIGQDKMKLALILNVINPRIGGVLVRGEKGTGKSTAVRALANLLPEIEVVAGCPCNCDPRDTCRLCPFCQERRAAGETLASITRPVPVVDLPVSATEDRVVGSLDMEYALRQGRRRFEPGILAQANRGFLYVDEVNLLDDHLVDILLDVAASGVNVVEREGIAFVHPARFVLVGTMNPEEGELRPQFLDRFGLCVPVEGITDLKDRVAILQRREAFDNDPLGFLASFAEQEQEMRERIKKACALLPQVTLPPPVLALIAELVEEAKAAGQRAEITMAEAARALAAWEGRGVVEAKDVERVADLVLYHRRRKIMPPQEREELQNPSPPSTDDGGEPKENETGPSSSQENSSWEVSSTKRTEESLTTEETQEEGKIEKLPSPGRETVFSMGEPFPVKRIEYQRDRKLRRGSGRRSRTRTPTKLGRYVRATLWRGGQDLAFDATLRAAAPYQNVRPRNGLALAIESSDLREKVRERRIGNFLLFVVDASGSMGAEQRMVAAKGAILSLLIDAYQKRDRVGMVAFKGEKAEVLLPPTNSVELAEKRLAELPTGGRTPLAAGLWKAYEVLRAHLLKDPYLAPMMIIVSDGRANVSLTGGKPWEDVQRVAGVIREERRIKTLVIDVEKEGYLSFGLARKLAEGLEAQYYKIEDLKADILVKAIRSFKGSS